MKNKEKYSLNDSNRKECATCPVLLMMQIMESYSKTIKEGYFIRMGFDKKVKANHELFEMKKYNYN